LYSLVRQNIMSGEQLQEIAENKRRVVQLYDLQLVSYESPSFTIQTRVSPGTYIRTLINDIAMRAGSCATTYQLARTAIGQFDLSQAVDLASINTIDDINRLIIPIEVLSSILIL
jgi:tRNA pseudouridine55 synthase